MTLGEMTFGRLDRLPSVLIKSLLSAFNNKQNTLVELWRLYQTIFRNWKGLKSLSQIFQVSIHVHSCHLLQQTTGNSFNIKGLYQSSGKEEESCWLVFPSSTKREIRHLHVVVVQRRLTNVQKSVMYVQNCCFANKSYRLFAVLVAVAVVVA